MPDWVTHIAAAWILCRVLRFRYKSFDTENTVLVMAGALIPDLVKFAILSQAFGWNIWNAIQPVHLPVGSFIIAGVASLLFHDRKTAFLMLGLGVSTHYILDLTLKNVGTGIYLLYPFYWGSWQLGWTTSEDYHVTIAVVILALIVYLVSRFLENRGTI